MLQTSELIDGLALADAFQNGELAGLCPEDAGIYIWLRKLSPSSEALATEERFLAWLDESLLKKQGIVQDSIRHIGSVELSIGGSPLGAQSKRDAVRNLVRTRRDRLAFQELLAQFDFTMALYVGESDNLLSRVRQHLSNQTDFSKRLKVMGYSWEELGLRFCVLPSLSGTERKAMERIVSILTLAPATSRAG